MNDPRRRGDLSDSIVVALDNGLKTLSGSFQSSRQSPADAVEEGEMSELEKVHASGLMRVNHVGEICAQALYEGQSMTAGNSAVKEKLRKAGEEERDHLAWCSSRLKELKSRESFLAPLFYASSFCVGAITGLLGDKYSLGFVEATEDRVVEHIDEHLDSLPEKDLRSRAILRQMREDEQRHGEEALAFGGAEFSERTKRIMKVLAGIMTKSTYRF
ncbi:MAG: 2-polyprenyl-3-methyl-6-methoxy-1,4-benzoquinone monooxygenase [Candidatus Azotimanducaceae bacterium]|tara:strand:+ start:41 stop:688 length:648 start_codon:yes stop_codon:yes gene_type:complete